jgi:hypothetical protein
MLNKQRDINIHEVLAATADAPTNKRAIQRVFKNLIERQLIEPHGNARARRYTLALLAYLAQPKSVRIPVGYDQNFLRSYQPNQTYYLSKSQRTDLLALGKIEFHRRPAGTYARHILNRLLIDLSWNSSRLEGNTYSLLETQRLIELGERAMGKDLMETQMILNHKRAIEFIIEIDKQISSHDIRSIHALLSENLLGDPSASGRIRDIIVGVGGSTYMPLENPHVLQECFQIFIEKLNLIEDPFEQSFFSLVHLSYMQAFEDVNKRTARLVANIPLIRENLNPLSFIDVAQEPYISALLGVYEKNDLSLLRDLYIWAYRRSVQRYSAIQQSQGIPNVLKVKYRTVISEIIQTLVCEKVKGSQVVQQIQQLITSKSLPQAETQALFKEIEMEVLSLHEGNIARFKILPHEFHAWKNLQLK